MGGMHGRLTDVFPPELGFASEEVARLALRQRDGQRLSTREVLSSASNQFKKTRYFHPGGVGTGLS